MDEWAAEFEYGLSTQAVSFKMEARCQRKRVKGWRLEAGGLRVEALRWRLEVRG